MNFLTKLLTALSLVCFCTLVQAEISLEHSAQVEVIKKDKEGKETTEYFPAEKILPGDTIIYTVIATNNGTEPANKIVVTNEVSEHVTYIIGSAHSSAMGKSTTVKFSADSGVTYAESGELLVTKDGEKQIAVAEDYTHIQWTLNFDLAPEKKTTLLFKARVK